MAGLCEFEKPMKIDYYTLAASVAEGVKQQSGVCPSVRLSVCLPVPSCFYNGYYRRCLLYTSDAADE